MKDQIEAQLRVLVGLPLWDAGRGADMEWFAFGARQTIPQRGGGSREVSEYALHVQCQWRLVSPMGIVTGRQDLYYPAGDPDQEPPDWEWDRQGANRCDERIAAFFAAPATRSLHVEQIWADQWGSVRVNLEAGYVLELMPANSLSHEHWRFFQPGRATDHFVVTGAGIEM